jgi:hypothetical protein
LSNAYGQQIILACGSTDTSSQRFQSHCFVCLVTVAKVPQLVDDDPIKPFAQRLDLSERTGLELVNYYQLAKLLGFSSSFGSERVSVFSQALAQPLLGYARGFFVLEVDSTKSLLGKPTSEVKSK